MNEIEQARLKRKFHAAMLDLYQQVRTEVYNPTEFHRMLHTKGGLETAKYLINRPMPSDGYYHLCIEERLDLTVEAFVTRHSEFHPLFEKPELAVAANRARQLLKSK